MINVLVTGIGGPTAQGVMRGLKDKENINIIGVDRRDVNAGIFLCDTFRRIPSVKDEPAYREAIREIVALEKVDIIFPCLHEEIEIYHHFQKELEIEVATPQSSLLPILLDKVATYQYLNKTELKDHLPVYYPFQNSDELREIIKTKFSEEEIIVAKQTTGHGALGFALLTDRETYLKELAKGKKNYVQINDYCDLPHFGGEMVMEYLDGEEYSVDLYLFEGEVIAAVPRERSGVSSGIVLDGKVTYEKELIELASKTAQTLMQTGFINLQFMTKGDSYLLTDVNPRFCGSQVMSLGAGINFPYLVVQYQLLGERPEVDPKWGMRMIRFRDQFFIQETDS